MSAGDDIPSALKPSYRMAAANDEVLLLQGDLEISSERGTWTGKGRVALTWFPSPGVRFSLTTDRPPTLDWITGKVRLVCPGLDGPVDALIESLSAEEGGKRASGIVTEPIRIGVPRRLSSVRFHALNLPHVSGELVRTADTGVSWLGRHHLGAEPFAITFDEIMPDVPPSEVSRYLNPPQVTDGYVLTHVGEISRSDGGPFAFSDVESIVDDVELFLRFVRGAPTPLVLREGIDSAGKVVWREWDGSRVGAYRPATTWCAEDSQDWAEAFAGLRRLTATPTWGASLSRIIRWYSDALAQPRDDGTVVVAQVCLEALSWVHCIQERRLLSEGSFEKIKAADKLSLLLGALGITVQSPAPVPYRDPEGRPIPDGPELVTTVRNALVHGTKAQPPDEVIAYAKALALTYVELALARLFGYSGAYANRLDPEGADHWVPWSTRGTGRSAWDPSQILTQF